jgi:PAS domain S-box-containing protein
MLEFYSILAYLTAGIALTMGIISLSNGLKNGVRTDFIFGAMAVCLFLFLLLPPAGFIINDQAPYPLLLIIKRIFIFSYYAVMPWFICSYSGLRSKVWPFGISGAVAVVYTMMLFTRTDQPHPFWARAAVIVFGALLVYGLAAVYFQRRRGDTINANWLMLAMAAFGVLFVLTAMNQFGVDLIHTMFQTKLFFSIHLHAIFLVLIMGFRLVMKLNERYGMEKKLESTNKRWNELIRKAPLFIVELDTKGRIVFVNDYAVNRLGYTDANSVTGRNWFDEFVIGNDNNIPKQQFMSSLANHDITLPGDRIRNRFGEERSIRWVSFFTYAEDGNPNGLLCVGSDATGEENANRLISQLKLELEKESVLQAPVQKGEMPEEIIGRSEAFGYVIQKARQVASTNAPVLLEGETGVGKELIADLIHKLSLRSEKPMIKVNCGALPKELIEDELFGHEKGAFTSAIQSRKGRFELAEGGTIFLDEIGELPLEMQPKLLRVLQSGEFERVGGQKTLKVDVRIIAATNRNLSAEVQRGRFRDDLFYRLNVFPITLPPLRKRKEDLTLLINHFISKVASQYNKKIEDISRADMQRLMEYTWPGNVRELKNVIERSVIACEGPSLKLDWFLAETGQGEEHSTLEKIERDHILKVMEECHWKINGENGAAERLDMHPNTLRSRMKKLGITRPVKDASELT